MLIKETGLNDVWRDIHTQQKDFTHYSTTRQVHSRIDYFLMNAVDKHSLTLRLIATADLSDYNVIYLTVHLIDSPKNTLW